MPLVADGVGHPTKQLRQGRALRLRQRGDRGGERRFCLRLPLFEQSGAGRRQADAYRAAVAGVDGPFDEAVLVERVDTPACGRRAAVTKGRK